MKLRAGIPLRRKKMGNSTYKFYGWRTADVKDSLDLTPRDYYDLLAECWSADTCAPRMRMDWSLENRTLGQCSITAFLIQDIYGGKVYGVPLEDGNFHCFNDVDGCVFDLTSEQFGDADLDYSNCPEQFRESHFSKEEKRLRYELLQDRLMTRIKTVSGIKPCTIEHAEHYGEIYAAAFSGEPWNDHWNTGDAVVHVRELLESPQSYGLEYVVDGKVVGFLLGTSMLFHYRRTFEINDLAVDPAYQKRGIAGKLLDRCLADMKARNIAGIHLITAGEGILQSFYEKYGFKREQEVILMGLEL